MNKDCSFMFALFFFLYIFAQKLQNECKQVDGNKF